MNAQAIRLEGVGKRYAGFTLADIDLDLARGRALGLIGPNGAGKSTLIRIVMGLVRPDAGRVRVLARAMPADEREIKSRVGFVSDDMALYRGKSLRWHMDLVASLNVNWDEARARVLLDRFELSPNRSARGLSRGQQVKALLLLALARRVELLVLDEPTAGLDPLMRHQLMTILAEAREDGCAILLSSHHGEDVAAVADEAAFLSRGAIVARAPVATFLGEGGSLEAAFLARVS